MRLLLTMCLAALFSTGLAYAEEASETAEHQLPAGKASGYPPAGGKGPGSGHSYQLGTAGPGQGSPNYQGGRDIEQAPTTNTSTGNSTPDSDPSPSASNTSGKATPAPALAEDETLPAVPGPYSRPTGPGYPATSGSAYPYYGGRGRGYGRHQRGYGYGYPGYRGLGGGQYPHHRQFGNPPMYPAPPAPDAPPASVE